MAPQNLENLVVACVEKVRVPLSLNNERMFSACSVLEVSETTCTVKFQAIAEMNF